MGFDVPTLKRIVMIESAIPLCIASIFSVAFGVGFVAWWLPFISAKRAHIFLPDAGYFAAIIVSILACLLIIWTILPILKKITNPEENRTE